MIDPPMPVHRWVKENVLVAMLATRRPAGVAPEVNLRKHVTRMPLLSASKAVHPGLKPRGDTARSPKQGFQWPHKRTYVLQFLKKNNKKQVIYL